MLREKSPRFSVALHSLALNCQQPNSSSSQSMHEIVRHFAFEFGVQTGHISRTALRYIRTKMLAFGTACARMRSLFAKRAIGCYYSFPRSSVPRTVLNASYPVHLDRFGSTQTTLPPGELPVFRHCGLFPAWGNPAISNTPQPDH
ncbi:hypothetical protein L596_025682 [Steinernema carpocapsae]|uniref:Uncharacterized protein n=1 Tax=Steinernema carpocapsae TaxID=34508 RepID=A0A4U5M9B3_STECR|nr:hypothetical protein L596_025682 [Steinernema carpocapsae]